MSRRLFRGGLCVLLVAAACAAAADASSAPVRVSVFFTHGNTGIACARVVARPRALQSPPLLRGALRALVAGPTAAERRAGFGGWFTSRTRATLRSVRIQDGVAHVDFHGALRQLVPGASSSCGSALLLSQLDRTVTQFPRIRRAIYSFDGNVRPFYEWLQRDVPPGA
jgi:spore germination protein GerM